MGDFSVDDLAAQMAVESSVSEEPVFAEHPRFTNYKNLGKLEQKQRARREEFLQNKRDRRGNFRNLSMLDEESDEEDASSHHMSTVMDFEDAAKVNPFKAGRTTRMRLNKRYADQLMLSEWLIDIPSELHGSWAMKPCPVGKRCLVVAKEGWTRAYNKAGLCTFQGATGLPGGSAHAKHGMTVLDCVRLKADMNVFYVLDLIAAHGMSFAEVDYVSRSATANALLEEIDINRSRIRPRKQEVVPSFQGLPECRCSVEAMTALMATEMSYDLDGLLFYNDQGWYTPGYTPLVGWLKPWMLPEILNVPVPAKFTASTEAQKPIQEFVVEYNDAYNHKFVHGKPWETDDRQSSETTTE